MYSIALLGVFAKHMYNNIQAMMQQTFMNLNPNAVDTTSIVGILYPYFKYLGIIVLPFFVFLFIFAIIVIRMDVGHVFSLEKAKFNLENLSPRRMLENAKRVFHRLWKTHSQNHSK